MERPALRRHRIARRQSHCHSIPRNDAADYLGGQAALARRFRLAAAAVRVRTPENAHRYPLRLIAAATGPRFGFTPVACYNRGTCRAGRSRLVAARAALPALR